MRHGGRAEEALAPHWQSGADLPSPAPDGSPFLIAVPTPRSGLRGPARERVRLALRVSLGKLLGCAPHEVPLATVAGRAPRLAPPASSVHLSISHEAGLSLAALRVGGPVGVDLMALADAELPDMLALARDYLGPQAAAELDRMPAPQRQPAFARAWTRHEACLKCLGLPLREWSPALARRIARCRTISLALPPAYVGAAALLD